MRDLREELMFFFNFCVRFAGKNSTNGNPERACVCDKSGEGERADACAVHCVG